MSSNTIRKITHLPSANKINDAKRIYEKVLGWEKTDKVLYGAFSQHPNNNDLDSVALKIELVDSLYKCNLRMNKTNIAKAITKKKLDLINGNYIKNVDTIAQIKPGHKRIGWVFRLNTVIFISPKNIPSLTLSLKKV